MSLPTSEPSPLQGSSILGWFGKVSWLFPFLSACLHGGNAPLDRFGAIHPCTFRSNRPAAWAFKSDDAAGLSVVLVHDLLTEMS
ncbi:hypothetical protein C1H46_030887 [Malus baccata]|uniref:Uncharacterized protein n=1 Tax=Malus baccata TaxID=106549 RepID=A0A540LAV4_MALBA|nr:hypothetical protein C1H46_030887 [Malus baccata]